jgi:heparin binding hemagglutinin HbhA
MPITTEVRKARVAVVDQSRAVLEDARKPLYAVVGAGDLAVSRTTAQLRELPADTQSAVDNRVKQVRTRIEYLRADMQNRITDLRGRATDLQDKATDVAGKTFKPSELKTRVDSYLDKARELYEDLALRGEKVVTKVADRPGVKEAVARVETRFDRAGDAVERAAKTADVAAGHLGDAAEDVEEAVEAVGQRRTTRKPAARKSTARKAAAK